MFYGIVDKFSSLKLLSWLEDNLDAGEVTIDKMSLGEMSVDEMAVCQ